MSKGVKIPYAQAEKVANALIKEFAGTYDEAIVAGSMRRGKLLIGDIDLVFIRENPKILDQYLIQKFGRYKTSGRGRRAFIYEGIDVQITDVAKESRGAALLKATGSATFNIICRKKANEKGWLLNEYGLWEHNQQVCDCSDELPILEKLDLQRYIYPILREV